MNSSPLPDLFDKFRSCLAIAAAALWLASCGDSSSTSGSTQGSASGFVTGFGSVVVDGVHYDDRQAAVSRDDDSGDAQTARHSDLRVGQRVEVSFDTDGSGAAATAVRVSPELVGAITAIDATAQTFVVAGQTVKVNADASAGAVTLFDGIADFAALQVGDRLEIHGSVQGSGTSAVLWATRIEREASGSGIAVRLTGTVSDLSADGRQFRIGSTIVILGATTRVTPTSMALTNGQRVRAFSRSALDTTDPAAPIMHADAVRIRGLSGSVPQMRVAGVISQWLGANSFSIDGVHIDASALASTLPAGSLDGMFARVQGSFDPATSLLTARQIHLGRDIPHDAQIELKGMITDFVSSDSFRVRNTPVQVITSGSNATRLVNGTLSELSNGAYVEIRGSITDGVLVASSLSFRTPESGNQVEIVGTLLARDTTAGTLSVRVRETTTLTVRVSASTTECEDDCTLASLAIGATLRIEGYLLDGVLVAREIRAQLSTLADRVDGHTDGTSPRLLDLEGRISALTDRQFVLNGRTITYDQNTVIRGGTLAAGKSVEATVVRQTSGELYARMIEIRRR